VSKASKCTFVSLAVVATLLTGCQRWPSYLYGVGHSSFNNNDRAITTANASSLSLAWHFTPPGNEGGVIYSSPTVYDGQIYVGSQNGDFYDLNETTGAVVWQHDIGQQTGTTCSEPENGAQGFASTATVDASTGTAVVYVAAPDGYLYAWNASTGVFLWRSVVAIPSTRVNDYFNWSSPTVYDGKIYVGVASACDDPLVQGGENVYNETTGQLLATFKTTPPNDVGGSIWSSAMMSAAGNVYVTTGNGNSSGGVAGYSESVIELNPNTLAVEGHWTVPASQQIFDSDFGGSATYWTADLNGVQTPMVGASNKNGNYFALQANDLAAGPVWTDPIGSAPKVSIGTEQLTAVIWDQSSNVLFLSGNNTTIHGTSYNGSVQAVNPATGAPIWQTGLPGAVMGTPSMDAAGVLAVGTLDSASLGINTGAPDAVYLLNGLNGKIVTTVSTDDTGVFAQPVMDDNYLFIDTAGDGIFAYQA
jgi:outer membrane protein assembly factor BamB